MLKMDGPQKEVCLPLCVRYTDRKSPACLSRFAKPIRALPGSTYILQEPVTRLKTQYETSKKLGRVNFRKDFWGWKWTQGKKMTNSWPARSQVRISEIIARHISAPQSRGRF